MDPTSTIFLRSSREYLLDTYLPRIRCALETLPVADLWWRPHASTNSVGNLLLHLEGNVRQWIVSGIGGAADHRERAKEFHPDDTAEGRPSGEELLERLAGAVREACDVLAELPACELLSRREIQGYDNCVLEAIYHVVEHFSWHTGQITAIAKARAGSAHGLAFYDEAAVNAGQSESSGGSGA